MLFQNRFFVILNGVKDLNPLKKEILRGAQNDKGAHLRVSPKLRADT
jgi:hypothetical protein